MHQRTVCTSAGRLFFRRVRSCTRCVLHTAFIVLHILSSALFGNFLRSPVQDKRKPLAANQPEQRSYRVQLLNGDTPVGEVSETLTITTTL